MDRRRREASERTTDAEGETFGVAGTEAVVKGFAQAYNSDAEFRIAQGHDLVPTEAARMIGHDVPRPGPEEAVTVYDRDGLKISAFLVNHGIWSSRRTAIASSMAGARR